MFKAAILHYNFSNPAPTAKDIQKYLKKSSKLLYGKDKRKTKTTPLLDKIHLVDNAYTSFSEVVSSKDHKRHQLYIFDDRINSVYFHLKYGQQIACLFKLDEAIADQMWTLQWNYGHLQRFKKGLEADISQIKFFDEKGVGTKVFHTQVAVDFNRNMKAFISEVEKELILLEQEALSLFKSGWD